MEAEIFNLLLKYGLPLLLEELQKSGLINQAQDIAATYGMKVVQVIDGITTYSLPTDFPNQSSKFTPSGTNI